MDKQIRPTTVLAARAIFHRRPASDVTHRRIANFHTHFYAKTSGIGSRRLTARPRQIRRRSAAPFILEMPHHTPAPHGCLQAAGPQDSPVQYAMMFIQQAVQFVQLQRQVGRDTPSSANRNKRSTKG